MIWLVLACWLVAMPLVALVLSRHMAVHSPGNGCGRHVEAELRERVGA
jgi:hypothetical protein